MADYQTVSYTHQIQWPRTTHLHVDMTASYMAASYMAASYMAASYMTANYMTVS